eukprot:7123692-Pyramimonas_sp.AAC.1
MSKCQGAAIILFRSAEVPGMFWQDRPGATVMVIRGVDVPILAFLVQLVFQRGECPSVSMNPRRGL